MKKNETPLAIVVSTFNIAITQKLLDGALDHLKQAGISGHSVLIVKVPGAIEIPLATQWLAKTKRYQAIIALGCVIRGETNHYDYVCQQVSMGCQQVMLHYNLPVIFGVLTTDNVSQAKARAGGRHGHKGREAAQTALEMIALAKALKAGKRRNKRQ